MRIIKSGIQVISVLGVLSIILGSCKDNIEEKRFYYPNGVLRKLIPKRQNKWEGLVWEYYSTGQLKSKVYWHDNKQHGLALFYYSNGYLQESTQWNNGKIQGKSSKYYYNGKIEWQANFYAGIEKGNAIFYDSTGKPKELQVYNERGQLIRIRTYNQMGVLSPSGFIPLIEAPDTIQLGKNFTGCIYFGYPLIGKTTMLIGTLVRRNDSFDRYQIQDTIAVVQPDQQEKFCFSYKPLPMQIGEHIFAYKFLQPNVTGDSLSINLLSGTHPFYVQIRSKIP